MTRNQRRLKTQEYRRDRCPIENSENSWRSCLRGVANRSCSWGALSRVIFRVLSWVEDGPRNFPLPWCREVVDNSFPNFSHDLSPRQDFQITDQGLKRVTPIHAERVLNSMESVEVLHTAVDLFLSSTRPLISVDPVYEGRANGAPRAGSGEMVKTAAHLVSRGLSFPCGCATNPLRIALTATETKGSGERFGCAANSSSWHTLNRAKFPSRGLSQTCSGLQSLQPKQRGNDRFGCASKVWFLAH